MYLNKEKCYLCNRIQRKISIHMSANNSFLVFSGTKTRYLAEKICASLGCPLGNLVITRFSDGEFAVSYEESIRGRDVFLVQSTFPSSDNLMELLLMIDAAKRASARTINAVIPYFGWARQDRKDKPRVSIGAKLVADLLSAAGIDRLITMDLHADQIQGFFDVPVDHLFASMVLLPYLQSLRLDNLCIASPDVGGSKRANAYAKYLGCPLVLCNKTRARAYGRNDYEGCRPDDGSRCEERSGVCVALRDEWSGKRPRAGIGSRRNRFHRFDSLHEPLPQGEATFRGRYVRRNDSPRG